MDHKKWLILYGNDSYTFIDAPSLTDTLIAFVRYIEGNTKADLFSMAVIGCKTTSDLLNMARYFIDEFIDYFVTVDEIIYDSKPPAPETKGV